MYICMYIHDIYIHIYIHVDIYMHVSTTIYIYVNNNRDSLKALSEAPFFCEDTYVYTYMNTLMFIRVLLRFL